MPRIKLEEQPSYEFSYTTCARVADLNHAAHVGAPQMTTLFHDARIALFLELGVSEYDLGDGKSSIIIGDLAVNYRSQAFWGNELSILTHIGEITGNSFRIFHKIMRGDALVALAEIGAVTFSFMEGKKTSVPEKFLKALAEKTGN